MPEGLPVLGEAAALSAEAAHLLARYAWAIDARDYESLADIFTEDVQADYQGFTCSGAAELTEVMERLHRGLRATQHLVGSVLAHRDGAGEVEVRSHVRATLVMDGQRRLEVGASYLDQLRWARGGWRICLRRVRGAWMDGDRSILPWMGDHTQDDRQTEGGP